MKHTLLLLTLLLTSCTSGGIALREQLGYAKREQLVDRVQDARDAQEAAKEQFSSTLEELLALTAVDGVRKPSSLETTYNRLKKESDRAATRASAVTTRITKVEAVAGALFSEWQSELSQYKNPQLRRTSEELLRTTRSHYDRLLAVMKSAEARMHPVLDTFNEHVLFLKHNLNAQAIASLQSAAMQIETDVTNLVRDLEASINEANAFIDQMQPR